MNMEQNLTCPWGNECLAEIHGLKKAVAAAKSWLAVADTYAKHRDDPDRSTYKMDYMRGREMFRDALYELEQP